MKGAALAAGYSLPFPFAGHAFWACLRVLFSAHTNALKGTMPCARVAFTVPGVARRFTARGAMGTALPAISLVPVKGTGTVGHSFASSAGSL